MGIFQKDSLLICFCHISDWLSIYKLLISILRTLLLYLFWKFFECNSTHKCCSVPSFGIGKAAFIIETTKKLSPLSSLFFSLRYGYMSPLSTKLPSDPSSLGAMRFTLWKTFGTEVLLQSDLINWYACKNGSGSILNWKEGSISCHVAKTLVPKCNNKAPSYFKGHGNYGMDLTDGITFSRYHFYKVMVMLFAYDGRIYPWTRPLMDACAVKGGENFVKGLKDPRGAWFVR